MRDLIKACDPFRRVANILAKLPTVLHADAPLRDVMPGVWPTIGDIFKLKTELDKYVECPVCHDANSCGDYEGPTCERCSGEGIVYEVNK